jgi:hypothetical protein
LLLIPLRVKWATSVNKILRINAKFLQNELPALLDNVSLQTRRQMYYQHDWSWRDTELATTVTGSEPIRLTCVGLHESCGVDPQGEHERRTTPAKPQRGKKHLQRCSAS